MVRQTGLEPARESPHDPKSCAYTNSATDADGFRRLPIILFRQAGRKGQIDRPQNQLEIEAGAAGEDGVEPIGLG